MVYVTSAAVIGMPSLHFALSRSGTVSMVPSSLSAGSPLARSGTTLRSAFIAYSSGKIGVYARTESASSSASGFSDGGSLASAT